MSIIDKELLIQRVDAALADVRPHLTADGGDVQVVDITEDMIVQVKWLGNCLNCNMSTMTLRAGIEQSLRSKMPEILGVVAIN